MWSSKFSTVQSHADEVVHHRGRTVHLLARVHHPPRPMLSGRSSSTRSLSVVVHHQGLFVVKSASTSSSPRSSVTDPLVTQLSLPVSYGWEFVVGASTPSCLGHCHHCSNLHYTATERSGMDKRSMLFRPHVLLQFKRQIYIPNEAATLQRWPTLNSPFNSASWTLIQRDFIQLVSWWCDVSATWLSATLLVGELKCQRVDRGQVGMSASCPGTIYLTPSYPI